VGGDCADHREDDDDRADDGHAPAAGDGSYEEEHGGNPLGETDENASLLRLDGGQSVARELGFVRTDVGDLGAAGTEEGDSENKREDRSDSRYDNDPIGRCNGS
jgi:hypothetical protein